MNEITTPRALALAVFLAESTVGAMLHQQRQ